MCRNPQEAALLETERTAHGVCLLLFERCCCSASGRNNLPSSVPEFVSIPLRKKILTNSAKVNSFPPLACM